MLGLGFGMSRGFEVPLCGEILCSNGTLRALSLSWMDEYIRWCGKGILFDCKINYIDQF